MIKVSVEIIESQPDQQIQFIAESTGLQLKITAQAYLLDILNPDSPQRRVLPKVFGENLWQEIMETGSMRAILYEAQARLDSQAPF